MRRSHGKKNEMRSKVKFTRLVQGSQGCVYMSTHCYPRYANSVCRLRYYQSEDKVKLKKGVTYRPQTPHHNDKGSRLKEGKITYRRDKKCACDDEGETGQWQVFVSYRESPIRATGKMRTESTVSITVGKWREGGLRRVRPVRRK